MGDAMEVNKSPYFKTCFVATCPNNTRTSPNKVFVRVPMSPNVFCCQDHFDLQDDAKMEYSKFKGATLFLQKVVAPFLNLLPYKIEFELSKLTNYERSQLLAFTKYFFHGEVEDGKLSNQIRLDRNHIQEALILSTRHIGTQSNLTLMHVETQTSKNVQTYLDAKLACVSEDEYSSEIDTTANLADLSLNCRTCLQVMPTSRNLARPGRVRLFQTLQKLVQVPLTLNANGVYNTCRRCEGRLEGISAFRQMCLYTHKKYLHEIELKKQSETTPRSAVINNSNRRKFVFDQTYPNKPKQPRLSYVNKNLLSSEDTLSANEDLIPPQNPLLSNSIDPWVVDNNNLQFEQSEDLMSDDHIEPIDLIDPSALTEMDGLDTRMDEDPLSLEPPARVQLINGAKSKVTSIKSTNIANIHKEEPLLEIDKIQENINTPSTLFQRPKIIFIKRFNMNSKSPAQKYKAIKLTNLDVPKSKRMKPTNPDASKYRRIKPSKKVASNPDLIEPFPQTQAPKYFVTKRRNTRVYYQRRKIRLANIAIEHSYAKTIKPASSIFAGTGTRAYLRQFHITDVFTAIEEFNRDMVRPKLLQCLLCHLPADCEFSLSAHMQHEHSDTFAKWCCRCNAIVRDQREHRIDRSSCVLYSCKFCCKQFKKPSTLLQHLEYHNREYFFPDLRADTAAAKSKKTKSSPTLHKMDQLFKTDPLKIFRKTAPTCSNSEMNTLSRDPLYISESVDSNGPTQDFLPPCRIKQEVEESSITLQNLLNEEIQIKVEPLSVPEDIADYSDKQLEIPCTKTQIVRLKVPKGVTDIVITDRNQKQIKKLNIEPKLDQTEK